MQDAAQSTLLRRRLQQLYGRIAAALEQEFVYLVERQPELLAHHLTGAGDTERAAAQWLKAGQHAAAQSAHVEAIAHPERGLSLLPSLPEIPERDSLEIDLQLALGMSSIRAKGMVSPAVREAYSRAGELAEKHGDERRLFQALYGVYQHNVGSGRIFAALPLAERLLSVTAHEDTDPGLRLQAHHALWTALLIGGEPARCLEHGEIGRQRYDPGRYQSHRDLYGGHDAGVCAWMMGSQAEWLLGHPDTALSNTTRGITLAERISHTPSLIYRREPELILARLTAAEAVAAEQWLSVFISPQLLRGMALFLCGQLRDAIVHLREGLPPGRTGGVRSLGFSILAVALAQQGDHAEGLAGLSEALHSVTATGERFWTAELLRSRGLVLQSQNKLPESEIAFKQACSWRDNSRLDRGSCAPRRALPGYGASKAGSPRPGSFWHPFCPKGDFGPGPENLSGSRVRWYIAAAAVQPWMLSVQPLLRRSVDRGRFDLEHRGRSISSTVRGPSIRHTHPMDVPFSKWSLGGQRL